MADPADLGNEAAETFRTAALSNRKPVPPVHGVGLCLNCGASVEGDLRWCDIPCRDDWSVNAQRKRS
jgi:hypothetical protein